MDHRQKFTKVLTKMVSAERLIPPELMDTLSRRRRNYFSEIFHNRVGTGERYNAVRIQIYCAIITYCLVAIIQHDMKLERSIYEILQILGISLTDKTHLRDLFDKSNIKNIKELDGSCEPNLFNF